MRQNKAIQKNKTKQKKKNRIFQNNESKFYRQVRRESTRTKQQSDSKEVKQFSNKIWDQKEHNRKVEWINK